MRKDRKIAIAIIIFLIVIVSIGVFLVSTKLKPTPQTPEELRIEGNYYKNLSKMSLPPLKTFIAYKNGTSDAETVKQTVLNSQQNISTLGEPPMGLVILKTYVDKMLQYMPGCIDEVEADNPGEYCKNVAIYTFGVSFEANKFRYKPYMYNYDIKVIDEHPGEGMIHCQTCDGEWTCLRESEYNNSPCEGSVDIPVE